MTIEQMNKALPGIVYAVAVNTAIIFAVMLCSGYSALARGDFFDVARAAGMALLIAYLGRDFWTEVRA